MKVLSFVLATAVRGINCDTSHIATLSWIALTSLDILEADQKFKELQGSLGPNLGDLSSTCNLLGNGETFFLWFILTWNFSGKQVIAVI